MDEEQEANRGIREDQERDLVRRGAAVRRAPRGGHSRLHAGAHRRGGARGRPRARAARRTSSRRARMVLLAARGAFDAGKGVRFASYARPSALGPS